MATYNARCIYGGYFEKNVIVQVDKRLSLMPHAQAGMRFVQDLKVKGFQLVSYESIILNVYPEKRRCVVFADYPLTRTTARHIDRFLREYEPDLTYYDIKAAYNRANEKGLPGEVINY